jgi:hypothetical protein
MKSKVQHSRETIDAALVKAKEELKAVRASMPAAKRALAEAYASGTTLAVDPTLALIDRGIRLEATISGLEHLAVRAEYAELRAVVDAWNERGRREHEKKREIASERAMKRMHTIGLTEWERRSENHAFELADHELREGNKRAQEAADRMEDLVADNRAAFDDLND